MELLRRASFLGSSESSVADREWSFIGDNIYLINSSTVSHKALTDPKLHAKFARRQTLAWCIDSSLSSDDFLTFFGDQCITHAHAHDGVTLADLFHITNALRFWTFPQRLQSCPAFEAPAVAFIEQSVEAGTTPRRMEWLAALGVTVTIVWLYLEILRLLSLLRR